MRMSEIWVNCSALSKAFMPYLFKVQRIPYKERKKECKSKKKKGGGRVLEMLFFRQKENESQCKWVFICLFTFWKGNGISVNVFKRRSWRWTPIQNDGYLEKKNIWTQRQPNLRKDNIETYKKADMWPEAETDWGMCLQANNPKNGFSFEKPDKTRKDCASRFQLECDPDDIWLQGSHIQNWHTRYTSVI